MEYKYNFIKIGDQRHLKMPSLICRLCGVSRTTASQYINLKVDDHRSIPSDHLRRIAKALNVQMEDLYAESVPA